MVGPWLGIVLVLAALLALQVIARLWRRGNPHRAELSRKLMHVSLGLLTLTFPWLFDEAWPVFVVCGAIAIWLIAVRRLSFVQRRFGGAIEVERPSWGEVYFPIGVALLFVLSAGNPILYCVPLAILTLADTAAALVGSEYGHWHFTTLEGGKKSAEGSVAFFLVAYFAVHVPLLLATPIERVDVLLVSVTLALLVTVFEAIAWRGLDNLFIPLGGFVLLSELPRLGTDRLVLQLGVVVLIAVVAALRRRRTTLDDSALLAAMLAGYGIWTFGGWEWLVLPVVLFLRGQVQPALTEPTEAAGPHFHHVDLVLSVAAPAFLWLLLARLLDRPELFFPFAVALGVHLGVFEIARQQGLSAARSLWYVALICGARAWLILFVVYVLLLRLAPSALVEAAWALPLIVLGVAGFCWSQHSAGKLPMTPHRWILQACWALVASFVAAAPLLALGR
jgi:phytol kinase